MFTKRRVISVLVGGYSILLGVFLLQQDVLADMKHTFTTCPLYTGQAYVPTDSTNVYYITKQCTRVVFSDSLGLYTYASPYDLLHRVAPNIIGTFELDASQTIHWHDTHVKKDISFVAEEETNDIYIITDRKKHKISDSTEFLIELYQAGLITPISEIDLSLYDTDVLSLARNVDGRLQEVLLVVPDTSLYFQIVSSDNTSLELRPLDKRRAFTKFLNRSKVLLTALAFHDHIDSQLRTHDADIFCEATEDGVCLYVSADGHKTLSDGSFHAPYRTFHAAVADSRLTAGSVIYAFDDAPFTYANTADDRLTDDQKNTYHRLIAVDSNAPSGTAEAPIEIKAYPGATPLFDMRGQYSTIAKDPFAQSVVTLEGVSHWRISDMTSYGGMWYVGPGTALAQTHDITIDKNTIAYIAAPQAMTTAGAIFIDRGTDNSGPFNINVVRNTISDVTRNGIDTTDALDTDLAGVVVLSRQTYLGDVSGTGAITISGNTFSSLPQAFLFADPMVGPVGIRNNTIYDVDALGTLHAANLEMEQNLVLQVPLGWLSLGGGAYGDARDEIDGDNAVIRYNTFVGIDSLLDLRGALGHNVSHNVFYGFDALATRAESDTAAYLSLNAVGETPREENSMLRQLKSNHNCFIVPSVESQFVSRSYIDAETPETVSTAHYTLDDIRSSFALDVSSTVHIGLSIADVFTDKFAPVDPLLCPTAGTNMQLLEVPDFLQVYTAPSSSERRPVE